MEGVLTLYAEELKATMRGRFGWLGAAVILFAVCATSELGADLDGFEERLVELLTMQGGAL